MSNATSNVSSAVTNSFSTGGAVVENDPAQRSQAMIANLLGIFGIVGTGIYYLVRKNDPKANDFVKSQIKGAFNFHLAVFVGMIVLQIAAGIALAILPSFVGLLVGLVFLAVWVGLLALVILNSIKANKGIAAKYPFAINVLK